jgi:hypothetical protein
VPHGPVLGPILFVPCATDTAALVQKFGLVPHLHADDTQMYEWSPPVCIDDLFDKFAAGFGNISGWMRTNCLQSVERGQDRVHVVHDYSPAASSTNGQHRSWFSSNDVFYVGS